MKYLQEISSMLKSYEAGIKSDPNSAFYFYHYDKTMKFLSITNVEKWVLEMQKIFIPINNTLIY